ncbi:MAG TPA: hypothetical protein VGJ84_04145 [Polyangiaceae bacterium]
MRPWARICFVSLALAAPGIVWACARTGLDPGELELSPSPLQAQPRAPDAGLIDVERPPVVDASPPEPPCQPSEEVCNGLDDDCNGVVDDTPPIPCPGGGFRYCVAGQLSACPTRCEVCMPGSERVCFNTYCKYWGTQRCSADGKSFSKCLEQDPPPECASVALTQQDSPELEQCCLDNGYCCLDTHDLNKNGNSTEMLGQCESVVCSQ